MATYNGHKNWAFWNVSLWIGNDDRLYEIARDCVRRSRTREQAAERFVSGLADCGVTETPDGARYTVASVRAAMRDL